MDHVKAQHIYSMTSRQGVQPNVKYHMFTPTALSYLAKAELGILKKGPVLQACSNGQERLLHFQVWVVYRGEKLWSGWLFASLCNCWVLNHN